MTRKEGTFNKEYELIGEKIYLHDELVYESKLQDGILEKNNYINNKLDLSFKFKNNKLFERIHAITTIDGLKTYYLINRFDEDYNLIEFVFEDIWVKIQYNSASSIERLEDSFGRWVEIEYIECPQRISRINSNNYRIIIEYDKRIKHQEISYTVNGKSFFIKENSFHKFKAIDNKYKVYTRSHFNRYQIMYFTVFYWTLDHIETNYNVKLNTQFLKRWDTFPYHDWVKGSINLPDIELN